MEKIRAKITSFLVFILSMIITFPCHAEKILNQPFAYGTPEKLVYDLKDFFREIEGEVLRVEGDLVTISAGRKNGINKYMRFDIVSSKKIKHPVTGEEIGTGDIKTGRIEITETDERYSEARLIAGTAEPGSRILLSKQPLKVYVEEDRSVDYFITEDFLRSLKKSGRFETVNDKGQSDITIILSIKEEQRRQNLLQTCLWSDSGQVFFESLTELSQEYLERIKKDKSIYEEELKGSDLLLSFRLPGGVRFLNVADVNGDGRDELIIARDNYLEIYALGVTLKGLYELKLKGEPLALSSADLNGDGRAEILVSVIQDEKAISQIYELKNGELVPIYRVTGLIRYLRGELLYQDYSAYDGPAGKIKRLEPPGFSTGTLSLNPELPFDLFSFTFLCLNDRSDCLTLIQDDRGYLSLYDRSRKIWMSQEDTGGFFSAYKKKSLSPFKEEEWFLRDRMIAEDNSIYLIKRKPLANMAKGLGWSSSRIVSLRWNGKELLEETIKEVGGTIIDFYLTKDRIYILQKPFMGISLGSLLKGENPHHTRLYIFKR